MNLLQLRSVCRIADNRLNISEAASALCRTQSTITRQIQELEEELGIKIFDRRKNRVLGITPRGKEVIEVARRIVRDADMLTELNRRGTADSQAQLTIATTHTTARYYLPAVVSAFTALHPNACFKILQTTPPKCYQFLQSRQVDLAVCSASEGFEDLLVEIPCFRCGVVAVAPLGHPLAKCKQPVTSEDIAAFPLIVIERQEGEKYNLSRALLVGMDIQPAIVLASGNVEVCKSYVKRGMGVAIIPQIAFEESDRDQLVAVDLGHLCAPVMVNLVARRDFEYGDLVTDFARMLIPATEEQNMRKLLRGNTVPYHASARVH